MGIMLPEKLQTLDDEEERGIQSQSTRTVQQIQNCLSRDCNGSETTEAIEKMVLGLRNLQIGDSTSVPYHLSKLEKQVKHVVRSIDGVSREATADFIETHRTQGEGDVHQIVHDAVIETTTEPIPIAEGKELDDSNEATRVSTSLLHRMIEELETKVEEESEQKTEAVSKEKIEIWEETEERFIRTIESVDDPDQSGMDLANENDVRNSVCNFAYEEITSSTPFVKSVSLEEVTIEEVTSSPMPVTSGRSKKMIHSETQSELLKRKGILTDTTSGSDSVRLTSSSTRQATQW
ncbi:hypothetical protein E2986_02528 [Frieseomelitta varia]|uniref:Uncharacterized protein n=1 Tax=Frieseomelitta varia TaxID=561572 RepID=A0A833VR23_9HYME|nr:hypothetical protein E2986_02528 [Frieseomelitta varia]